MVKSVESLEEFKTIIKKDVFTVFDFWATWYPSKIEYYKVDVDAVPDVAQEVGVRAMPTFFLFKNGEKVDELVGANPAGLNNLIAKAK
ncbi:thioredoxin [Pyrrhoderma noxium]|uniref:Thioredoxin n=1 Tax=Pyrrhoderma noxium TaxID=2282107 RepID=A0A286USX3_9AGAM|nr:thioredoxin [Pyrrhoderma noxium]